MPVNIDTLRRLAAELDCYIEVRSKTDADTDTGPYWLRTGGYDVWGAGLSAAHVLEALDCLSRERDGDENAWRDFGNKARAQMLMH